MHRYRGDQTGEAADFAVGTVKVGICETRCDCVHANSFFRHLPRQPHSESIDSSLGGGVVHPFSRATEPRGQRRDIHDRAALSSVTRRHSPNRFAATQDRTRHVDSQDCGEDVRAKRIDAREAARDARIVHEASYPAKFKGGCLEQVHDLFLTTNIALDCGGAAAGG